MKKYLLFLFVILNCKAFPQTFNGVGGPIPDDGTHGYFICNVSGVNPASIDTSFGLETVCIDLEHTWDDDLVISLIAPDGTEFELTSRNGGDGDNYTNTCFNYDASTPIYNVSAPFTGTFRPEGFMSLPNNGQNPNGTWTLHILDTYPFADNGTLFSWSLTFGNNPAVPFPFSHADLPLLVINTNGQLIPSDDKITAGMRIINNPNGLPNHIQDSANIYSGKIGIELHGHSASSMPKKSFSFETRNNGGSSLNTTLLGMPQENDWTLTANYSDKSLLRNYYSYLLFNKMGHYAPRMRFCEVVLDGEYQGIYLLGEKIKQDQNRVNVHSMSTGDTTGLAVTGGYIFKLDWEDAGDAGWNSNFTAINASNNLRYLFVYPKPDKVQQPQINYIKSYVDDLEYAMNSPQFADTVTGYRQYIDEQSFIDFIILIEFTKNVDAYRLSTYFYKDRYGKICAGPPWDYDLSWGNADYMEGYLPSGWDYMIQQNYTDQCPFWWQRFFQDTLFMNKLKCRWEFLRLNVFNPAGIKADLDSLATVLGVSTELNFTKWPILGIYVWPNPAPIPTTYEGEIDKLKDWTDLRITWLDNHWTGNCLTTTVPDYPQEAMNGLSVFPNPNNGSFRLDLPYDNINGVVQVFDLLGNIVFSLEIKDHNPDIQLECPPGVYYLRHVSNNNITNTRIVIE